MLQFIEYKHIDLEKWNKLISLSDGQVFSNPAYFEPLAEHWGAVILGDYQAALIVPFKKKLIWSWVYTPKFYRASYWIGQWTEQHQKDALDLLQKTFPFGELNLEKTSILNNDLYHQIIHPQRFDESQYNTLTKRMIKKAEASGVHFTNDYQEEHFLSFLQKELGPKIDDFQGDSIHVFRDLLRSLNTAGIFHFEGAVMGGQLVGGLITVEIDGCHLYLKGTANLEAKKSGVYFMLMHRAIQRAVKQNCIFDFGGSRIDGVAQFNRNFGAADVFYANHSWGKRPRFFDLFKAILGK
jgi:lipid II:glycine glycyltransferase (peptidoglycan interpeptide bridge formation enzyme)